MILAYAGRRAPSLAPDLDALAGRVRALLAERAPDAVLGAAADGGDLLVVEAALALGIEVHVLLPTAPDVFREHSVAPEWGDRYERALAGAASVESLGLQDGADAYRAANAAFLERADAVLAVAVEGEGEMVEDLLAGAAARGLEVLRVS